MSNCYPNLHLTPEEYGLWNLCRSLSHQSGVLYFDGRQIAGLFAETGKNTIYRVVKKLVAKGWLQILYQGRDPRTGHYLATRYRPVTVEEWNESNPHDHRAETNAKLKPDESSEDAAHTRIGTGPFTISGMTSPGNGTYSDSVALDSEASEVAGEGNEASLLISPCSGTERGALDAGHADQRQEETRDEAENLHCSHFTFKDAFGDSNVEDEPEPTRLTIPPTRSSPYGQLPLTDMVAAVWQTSGRKVFFPKEYHAIIRELVTTYGSDVIVEATGQAAKQLGATFKDRGFAAWLLKQKDGAPCRLGKILNKHEYVSTNGSCESVPEGHEQQRRDEGPTYEQTMDDDNLLWHLVQGVEYGWHLYRGSDLGDEGRHRIEADPEFAARVPEAVKDRLIEAARFSKPQH